MYEEQTKICEKCGKEVNRWITTSIPGRSPADLININGKLEGPSLNWLVCDKCFEELKH